MAVVLTQLQGSGARTFFRTAQRGCLKLQPLARRVSSSARIYTSVRSRDELYKLTGLQDLLLANFCILTDSKGKLFSKTLSGLAESTEGNAFAVVDVEMDKGDVQDAALEFGVTDSPMIVAIARGQRVDAFSTPGQSTDPENLVYEMRVWLDSLPN